MASRHNVEPSRRSDANQGVFARSVRSRRRACDGLGRPRAVRCCASAGRGSGQAGSGGVRAPKWAAAAPVWAAFELMRAIVEPVWAAVALKMAVIAPMCVADEPVWAAAEQMMAVGELMCAAVESVWAAVAPDRAVAWDIPDRALFALKDRWRSAHWLVRPTISEGSEPVEGPTRLGRQPSA